MSPHRAHVARFVGRDAELTRLQTSWQNVSAGRAELVLLAGEAGVGKTRLLVEFCHRVGPSARVLWGECIDLQQGGLAYAPFRQALRSAFDTPDDTEFADAVRMAGADLSVLLPGLDADATSRAGEEVPRVRLFESLLDLLRRLSAHRRLLVIIEDAHWADDTTLDLLTFLVRTLSGSSVLLLTTFRPTLAAGNPALMEFLVRRAGRTATSQFTLDGLLEHELADYLSELTGAEPDAATVAELARRSDGNPLFVQEIVAGGASGEVPQRLSQLLLGRISGLPVEVGRLLRVAAVAGQAIPHGVLHAVSTLEPDDLTAALHQAIEADVLREDATIGGYTFRHALLQEALYANLLLHERQALHRRYADELSRHSSAAPLIAGAVATHWDKAGEPQRALPAYVQAAAAARASFAFVDVERYLGRAYALWREVADADAITGLSRRHLANRLVNAALATERQATAVTVARETLARVDPDADPLAAAFQHGQLSRALWYAGHEDEAEAHSRSALEMLDDRPTIELSWVTGWHADLLALNGNYSASRALAERAMAVATAVGAPGAFRVALATYGSVVARQGNLNQGWSHIDHAELLARKRRDADEIMRIFLLRGRVLQTYGRWSEARENYAEGISQASKYGMTRRWQWRLHVLAARMLFVQGQWQAARGELIQAREHVGGRGAALPTLLVATGEFSAAEELFDRHRTRWRSDGTGLLQMPEAPVEAAVWQGDHDAARIRYERGIALVEGSEELMPEARLHVAALRTEADAAAVHGQVDATARAEQLIARLRAMGALRPPRANGYGSELAALLATGEAEYARCTRTADGARWGVAYGRWQALAMPYPAAYALLRMAEALLERADRDAAIGHLEQAATVATSLGAAPLAAAIDLVQRRALGRPTTGDHRHPWSRFSLTEREHQVADALVRGATNREIAEELFIAEGTASVHVSNILRKLGVGSRGVAIATLLGAATAD